MSRREACHMQYRWYRGVMANGVVSHMTSCHRGGHGMYSAYIKELWQMVSCHICNHATEEVMSRTLSLISRSHGKWSRVTYDVMSHMTSCHIWRHVTYDIMSQRESCHVQRIYQGVMPRTESCQRWSHVTEGVMSRTVSISISHVTYRVMSDMESCHVGSHVRGLIGVSIGRGEVKFVFLERAF